MKAGRLARVLRASSVAGALLALAAGCSHGPPERARCDVVLISLDSTRADVLTFLDARTSPNLARLAARGTVFTQAVSGTSWTLPAHAQMFTGQPPAVHGVQADDMRIDPRTPTVATKLRDAGYRCVGFWTAWYLSGEYGFARGFHEYRSCMSEASARGDALEHALAVGGDASERRASFTRELASHTTVNSGFLVDAAIAAVRATPPDAPLFLFGHLFDPHYDYIPPEPFASRFDPDYEGTISGHGYWENRGIWDEEKEPPRRISSRDLEHIEALYRGEVAGPDDHLGRLLDALDASGRLENTLFVVTSDHGEEFFEHEGRGHRQTLFEEVLRVPLLVVAPNSAATNAGECDALVSLSDLMPTILDYAGAPVPASVLGRSLRDLVEGGAARRGDPDADPAQVATLWVPHDEPDGTTSHWLVECLRTPGSKLVRTVRLGERAEDLAVGNFAWYDLIADPLERSPVQRARDPRVVRDWARLEREKSVLREHVAAQPSSPLAERMTHVAELFHQDLAALGYGGTGEVPGDEQPILGAWSVQPLPALALPAPAASGAASSERR